MSDSQKVLVTYSGSLTFLQSDQWKQVLAALNYQLPLRNLHWKSANHASVRTIQTLPVELAPLEGIREESTSQVPQTILARPLLNLFVFTCEDVDIYKSTIRKQIKEWHALVSERKQQEYIIIHVARPETRVASGGIFRVQSTVLDRVRSDFNTDKRERCVQLAWSQGTDTPAAWAELVIKLKEGVLGAFDAAITQREEEVKRSESQRTMPGWNFCTFFVLKESLASSFEGVKLYEDALSQYDSLETSFFTVLQEKSLSWFGNLTPEASSLAAETSLPLLSVEKKAYRDLILANTISVFDFRVYLLARQCNLLGKMGRVVYVAKKVTTFLGAFGRRLRDVADNLPPFFVEVWSYTSALSVVEQCDIWAAEADLESSSVMGFNSAKAELLENARKQLDILGIRLGHLPARPPFSASTVKEDATPALTNATAFLKSLEDPASFYELYIAITNRAIDLHAKAGRKKFALRLHGDLAALDMHRGRVQQAAQTYASLPAHYAHYKWTVLESFMHGNALDLMTNNGSAKDNQWLQTAFTFLRLMIVHGDGSEDHATKVESVVRGIMEAVSDMTEEFELADHPMFKLHIDDGTAALLPEGDGSSLRVSVLSKLPCSITVGQVIVTLDGRNKEQFAFEGANFTFQPGSNQVNLTCSNTTAGTFFMSSNTIRLGKVALQYNHRKASTSKTSTTQPCVLVKIPRDPLAVDIQLHQPQRIELGAPSSVRLTLYSGRMDLEKITIKLKGPGSVSFMHSKASSQSSDVSLEAQDECINLEKVVKDSTVSITVPHSNASSFQSIEVNILLEYSVATQPTMSRSISLTREVVTSLPLQVNVQDFFRGTSLFSRFTISTTSHQCIRVSSAELEVDSDEGGGIGVTSTGSSPVGGMIVTPAHPTNFLFKISSERGPVTESLKLKVTYRTLQEEATYLLQETRRRVRDADKHAPEIDAAVSSALTQMDTSVAWSEHYRMTGQLDLALPAELSSLLPDSDSLQLPWRELMLPVDIPQMNILCAVKVQLLTTDKGKSRPLVYAGQPIAAEISIQTSFHWGAGHGQKDRTYQMRFDVEEMVREWLVSGRKRGDFAARDGGTYTVPITLIALNHGELPLPRVSVSPLPLTGEMTMGSMALPSSETHQLHGAERVLILPRGGRTTFVVGMGGQYQ